MDRLHRRGMLDMLRRNKAIKDFPQHWQHVGDVNKFDLLICFEHRVKEKLLDDLRSRREALRGRASHLPPPDPGHIVWIVTLDVRDAVDDAAKAAEHAQFIVDALMRHLPDHLDRGQSKQTAMESLVPGIVKQLQRHYKLPPVHCRPFAFSVAKEHSSASGSSR